MPIDLPKSEVLQELSKDKNTCKLKTAMEQMFTRMEELSAKCTIGEGGLSKKELFIVNYVAGKTNCIMRDIAEFLNAPVSTLTSIIDKLVRKKQLSRERSEEDRRIVNVTLGEEGKETFLTFETSKYVMSKTMLSALDEAEQSELIRLMEKITINAKKV